MKIDPKPNAQNAHIINSAQVATAAAKDLSARGHTLYEINIFSRNPLIKIRSESRCQQLQGAVRMIRSDGHGGRVQTMSANHLGAQVEWEVQL